MNSKIINPDKYKKIYKICVQGLKNYINKTKFNKITLGLSGGIDSALCATIASDAIGEKNIYGIIMPSKYSSKHSIDDAIELAKNLKINVIKEPIQKIVDSYLNQLRMNELAKENIQARVRGNILMSFSNTNNCLVIATGNKSELSVGYSTMYGDTVGGYAPIMDIYKTDVWKLAKWRNSIEKVIPDNSINKEPSAELKPGQKDSDSLPEYKILDKILYAINKNESIQKMNKKWGEKLVKKIINKIATSEWKRSQYPIGPIIL